MGSVRGVELAPAGTVAAVEGRSGGTVFVVEDRGRFRVQAGPPDDRDRQLTVTGIERHTLDGFAETLTAHLESRSGERLRVPYDQAFPACTRLEGTGGAVLNVYDDGDDFSVMVVDSGAKASTGTGVTLAAMRDFAASLSGRG